MAVVLNNLNNCNLTAAIFQDKLDLKSLIINNTFNFFNPVRMDDVAAFQHASPIKSDMDLAIHFYKSLHVPNWVSITFIFSLAIFLSYLALNGCRKFYQEDRTPKNINDEQAPVINLNQVLVFAQQ